MHTKVAQRMGLWRKVGANSGVWGARVSASGYGSADTAVKFEAIVHFVSTIGDPYMIQVQYAKLTAAHTSNDR